MQLNAVPVEVSSSVGKPPADWAMQRLQASRDWYDRHAKRNNFCFRFFKVLALLAAAAIPFLSGFGGTLLGSAEHSAFVIGLLGVAIVVIEGLQQLYQWHENWLSYRATCEALDRERYLYLASAGPYA